MYGGMGGYSSMYGGMGGGYGGYGGGMYGGMPGEDPNNPSLTQSFNQSTQATFQIIESLVGAFGGFAQMLESTYMATRSSFFGKITLSSNHPPRLTITKAMVSVAEQFGTLRNTLGSVLGIFTILRWLRTLLAKITGRPPPADATSLTPANFSSFLSGTSASGGPPATLPDGSPAPPRPSKKPFIMFALAVVGLPYLMSKLIKALARSQEAEAQQRLLQQQQNPNLPPFDPNNPQATGPAALDPTKLAFCRALYDYTPDPQLPQPSFDLTVKKGDLVAVLSQTDPLGNPSQWWRCRARDGKMGYLPAPYLETVKRPDAQRQITAAGEVSASAPGSRTTTLRGSDGAGGIGGVADADGGRTKSLDSAVGVAGKPEVKGRPGDISAESFQKSAFYSG